MEEGQTLELTDSRDGNTYKVRKLADGQCWMIQNLRLGDSKLSNRILTSDNSADEIPQYYWEHVDQTAGR